MSFRADLLRRAAARRPRIVLPEAGDPRVQAAAARLANEGIATPILIGPGAIDPVRDPRYARVAQHLRDRRPDRVHDAVHALDLATRPIRFGASLWPWARPTPASRGRWPAPPKCCGPPCGPSGPRPGSAP